MTNVNAANNEMTNVNIAGLEGDSQASSNGIQVTAEMAKTQRKAKKRRSEATLEARKKLKQMITKEMKRQKISVADFAEQQGNKRQYIYRALSLNEDAASIDQLIGFAGDLGITVDITASS